MRIALVVPNGQRDMNAMGNVARPPLGVCYLKSYLAREGFSDVKIFHQVDENNSELIEKILSFKPNIVGFSVMSCAFSKGVLLAKLIKKHNSEIKTVFGGEHITGIFVDETRYGSKMMTKTLKNNNCIDFLIPFEGEISLSNLVKGICEQKSFEMIKGIVYRDFAGIHLNTKEVRIENLDDIPIADRGDLPYKKYHSIDDANDLEYMHTTRGCKYNCTYCATPVSNPGSVAKNSAARIFSEMDLLFNQFKRKSFFFCDELFTADPERIRELCHALIDSGIGSQVDWRVFARVDDVSEGKIDLLLMKRAGLKGLFFGVESLNLRTLRKLGKKTTVNQVRRAIEITHNAGIDVWCSLMIGYPWETEAELMETITNYLTIKDAGFVRHTYVAFITPFPGTPFYNFCVRNKLISNHRFLELNCNEPVLRTPIKNKRLIEIYNDFLVRIS